MSAKIWTMDEIEELKAGRLVGRPTRPVVRETVGTLGEVVGECGYVRAHLFLAPPDCAPYGVVTAPRDSGSDIDALVFGGDAKGADAAFYGQ